MPVVMEPIGVVHTTASEIPRHWTVSEIEGTLEIEEKYLQGLQDIKPGQKIIVIFYFDRSSPFSSEFLVQTPPHRSEAMGVFSICSPRRPNPIGLSVLEVLGVEGSTLQVKAVDMYDGTPILDIKPFISPEDA